MKRARSIDSEITLKNYQRELELCQKSGGDIEKYRRLSFNAFQLEQIRLGLEHGINTDSYTDPSLSWMEMECAREMEESGFDMSAYLEQKFTWLQCGEILEGKKKGLDVSVYAKKEFLDDQMKEIRKGLERGVDVSLYAMPSFEGLQMREIRKGLEKGLDVSRYATNDFKYLTMRALRKGLEKGFDLIEYGKEGYGGKELFELIRGLENKNPDIRNFFEKGYKAEQLEQINNAFDAGVNLLPYISIQFYGAQLEQIVKGLKKGLDVSIYAKEAYNWFQMRELRFGLEDKIDVSPYANPDFTYRQMAEIRKGILAGVDVSQFAKIYFEPEQMAQMCQELQNEEPNRKEDELELLEEKYGIDDALVPSVGEKEVSEDDSENEIPEIAAPGVVISEDKMKVYLHLSPKENGEQYTIFEVTKMLRHRGVKQGINNERVKEVIEKKMYDQDVLVAEGKPAVDGQDGKFQFYFRRELKRRPKVLENGAVDYKNMDLFETVKKDQLLAEYEPPTRGEFGFDITGQFLSPKKGKELPPLHGEGFFMSDDRKQYFALLDGIVELENDEKLSVRNMFVVTGDVDTSTGNIMFDGDVNVMGNVISGFRVEATGNVVIDGRCEGCTVKAGKDILIRLGCQGQGTGILEAGGTVTGQFFESVKVVAQGDVEASYFLNSNVSTTGKLKVQGRRGVIIGGYVRAKQGIECFGVGNVAEVKTVLEVGIDKEDMSMYQEITKHIHKINTEIETLEAGVVKLMAIPEKDEETTNFFNRLTKALYSKKTEKKDMEQKKHDLIEMMAKQRSARIVVNGIVYPGTKLYINTEPYVVKEECRNVQFVKQETGIVIDK